MQRKCLNIYFYCMIKKFTQNEMSYVLGNYCFKATASYSMIHWYPSVTYNIIVHIIKITIGNNI